MDNNVEFPNKDVNSCIDEAIKCHHIEITNYLIDNFQKKTKISNQLFVIIITSFSLMISKIDQFLVICVYMITLNFLELHMIQKIIKDF